MSFEQLSKKELLRTAEEDFAVEVDRSWPKAQIIKQLEEYAITWPMYLEANPEAALTFGQEIPANIVTEPVIAVAPPVLEEEPKVLIKMTRANPLYEIGRYRWTQKHPYVLVAEKDAERILIHEEGFRQATPGELQEYYS